MAKTTIEWASDTWNPVRGCSKISPGCKNCYAMRHAIRFAKAGQPYHGLVKSTPHGPEWTGLVRPSDSDTLRAPLHWRLPKRIFVNSMSDLFHEDIHDWAIEKVFAVMALCSRHTFIVLTKRSDRARRWFKETGDLETREMAVSRAAEHIGGVVWDARGSDPEKYRGAAEVANRRAWPGWPLPNVWLMVSVEDQAHAGRVDDLIKTPAAIRGVSYEPALRPVDFRPWLPVVSVCPKNIPASDEGRAALADLAQAAQRFVGRLDWVIVGGESGPGARPFDVRWARSTIEQCKAASVACFVKQLGARPFDGLNEDGSPSTETIRFALSDRKGGDPAGWPPDLRVREYPE